MCNIVERQSQLSTPATTSAIYPSTTNIHCFICKLIERGKLRDMRSFDHKPYDYSDRVMRAKELIDAGHEVSDSLVPRYLVESWQRSHDLGVRIDDHLEPSCFTQRILSDEDRVLSSIVGDEIDAIWNSFGGEHWAVYCTSPEGLITRARHGTNPHSEAYVLHVGRRIQERDVGTTAPACAYHAKRPIMLSGNEHFLNEFSHLFCCAVPIWGAWGEIVGVLNVTGSEEFKSKLVRNMLTTASIKIQNRIFLQTHRDARIFKFHFDAEFVDTHHAGLIATTSKGDVISATYNALEMLDPIDPIQAPWRLLTYSKIFRHLTARPLQVSQAESIFT